MKVDIKPRHIKDIENLPISQLSDEEILKVAFKRLGTSAAMLVYESENRLVFLGRYSIPKKGYHFLSQLKKAWEKEFGKFKKETED